MTTLEKLSSARSCLVAARAGSPTSSSWLNQIGRWFAEITRKRIRRGSFRSVRDLVLAMHDDVRSYNRNPQPFHWIASASRIIRESADIRQLQKQQTRYIKRHLVWITKYPFKILRGEVAERARDSRTHCSSEGSPI